MNDQSIEVAFLGPVRRPAGAGSVVHVPVPDPPTVAGVLRALGYTDAELPRLHVLREGERCRLDDAVQGTARLTIFLPLGGG